MGLEYLPKDALLMVSFRWYCNSYSRVLSEYGGNMEIFFIVLAIIAAGAILVYFLNSPKGMQLVRKKSVQTILNDVKAIQSSAPQTPLHEIYYSLAEERNNKSKWLAEFGYLILLRDAGCFDERTVPQPEQFAELMASVEEKIRLRASGMTK